MGFLQVSCNEARQNFVLYKIHCRPGDDDVDPEAELAKEMELDEEKPVSSRGLFRPNLQRYLSGNSIDIGIIIMVILYLLSGTWGARVRITPAGVMHHSILPAPSGWYHSSLPASAVGITAAPAVGITPVSVVDVTRARLVYQ